MQKILTLILVLLLIPSVNSFSQTVTKDTSKVILSTEIARMIILELKEKDQLVEINKNLENQVESWKSLDSLSTEQIQNLQERIKYYKELNKLSDATGEAHRKKIERLEQQVSKSTKTSLALGTIAVATTAGFIITLLAGSLK